MSNSIEIQRRVALDRAKALFIGGATIDHVLGFCWNAGFCEGDRDTGAETDAEFDRRLDEINREIDAIESGCVEPNVWYSQEEIYQRRRVAR
jgi:hypothetical protein